MKSNEDNIIFVEDNVKKGEVSFCVALSPTGGPDDPISIYGNMDFAQSSSIDHEISLTRQEMIQLEKAIHLFLQEGYFK